MNMKCVCVQKIKIPIFHDKNLLNAILMSFNFFFFFLGGGGGGFLPYMCTATPGQLAAFQSKKDSELGCSQCQCL
jgi:hypothetical protein